MRMLIWIALSGFLGFGPMASLQSSPILSESFTEDSLSALLEKGFEPGDESRATEFPPEAGLVPDPGFPEIAGATGGALRLCSASVILPFDYPNGSFWISFLMQRESAKGFPLLILRGKLKHHLIKIGDLHDDRVNGISASLAGAELQEPATSVASVAQANLIVAHYSSEDEKLTLWVNPPVVKEEPSADSAYLQVGPADPARPNHQKPPFGSVELQAPPNCVAIFDEIRIAETWAGLGLSEKK